jgi:predicted regulator of Ras-like GTPase activity (Roadblock/LC7/MglB family)
VLRAHCADSDCVYAAVIEESGLVLAQAGDATLQDQGETAALAAGAYHAVRETARRLGEPSFEGLSHQGVHRHFHLSPVDTRFLLLSVFGNDTRLALVRACAVRTAGRLREAIAEAETIPVGGRRLTPADFHGLRSAVSASLLGGDLFSGG